ncbi:MAG: FGGY-family carbohydrate kinase [Acetanaerobacterium sp.]
MKYLLGIDIGTQSTRAALVSEQGVVFALATEPSKLHRQSGGQVWQEPEQMYADCLTTIKAVMLQADIDPRDVCSICIDGQMAGVMGIDTEGRAVTPYDSWLDQRCEGYWQPIKDYGEQRVISITGAPVTYAHGPKILWWKYERPEVYARIHRFVMPAAYLTMRMCALKGKDAFIDHTYLHFTGFADTKNRAWSPELLDAFGVDPNKMPRIVRPWDIAGTLSREAADACLLREGIPMVCGCGDTAACALGAGVTAPGTMFDVAGTASVFACATDTYAPDTEHKTILYARSVLEDLYMPMAYLSGGGMCLRWFRDTVLGEKLSYHELDEMAASVACGSDALLFLPYFSGRVCPQDASAFGAWLGLSWQHGPAQMYRSIIESIAYEYHIYLDILRSRLPIATDAHVLSIGGGAISPIMNQIKADVLGLPVSTLKNTDHGALGCAVIAGYGVGLYPDIAAAVKRLTHINSTCAVDAQSHSRYAPFYEAYKASEGALRPVCTMLSAQRR